MQALSLSPYAPYFNIDCDPIAPINSKADLVAAALPGDAGKSLARIAVESTGL